MVAHLAIARARELLRRKAPFVWNATHLSELMRKKTLDLLYSYHAHPARYVPVEQDADRHAAPLGPAAADRGASGDVCRVTGGPGSGTPAIRYAPGRR
ncbi:hypothetical protein G6F57_022096 [Rhizopus arrhizus]|nr:hypothetical protein G6F57_022096 [Rhizopus arrhizus]